MSKKLAIATVVIIIVLTASSFFLYDYGLKTGYATGNLEGIETGEKTGYNEGYDKGYDDGFKLGQIRGYSTGYSDGYGNGTIEGAGTGYNIRDPTYSEMTTFIKADKTNERIWSESYTCFNFVNDVLVNAFNSGYKAGMVYIEFADGAHGVVCFDTTDRGMIFVEPQTDDVVKLQVGQAYEFVEEPNIVLSYTIIW